jgi:hypothetical protein
MFMSYLFEPDFGVVDLERSEVHALGRLDTAVTLTTPDDIAKLTAEIVFFEPTIRNENLAADDFRRGLPRFQPETLDANQKLVAKLEEIAVARGVTAAQLALAWLLAQGDDIVPIPGARRERHLSENVAAADLKLDDADLEAISAALPPSAIAGERYTQTEMAMIGL